MSPELVQFADYARGFGAVTALAVVCLMQYAYHLVRSRAAFRERERLEHELDDLTGELGAINDERQLATMENEFLREFVSQTELRPAIDVLLRRLVPHPSRDFAILLLYRDGRLLPHRARGMDLTGTFAVDEAIEQRVLRDGLVEIEGENLPTCRFLASLKKEVRGRARQLIFLRVGTADDPVGLLVTTALYPAGTDRRQQVALAMRLTSSVAGNLKWARTLESREDELKVTTEMLELRSITDRSFPTPLAMIERFIDGLRRILGAERAALFLATRDGGEGLRPIARAGVTLGPGIDTRLQQHEARLAEYGLAGEERQPTEIDASIRIAIGVNSLVEQAIIVPVVREEALMGVVVLVSQRNSIDRSRGRLLEWAGGHLARTLDRVLVQASAERRARQDALTELANRGEFDTRIAGEIDRARASGTRLTLLLIDLDHFKRVNDTFGHRAGDEVLKATARVLRRSIARIRSGDRALVARYGGEELAVLLPGMGAAGAHRVAEDLRSDIEQQVIAHDSRVITVTSSIGLATFPECADDVDGLVGAADAALYQAKERGRNRVVRAMSSAFANRETVVFDD